MKLKWIKTNECGRGNCRAHCIFSLSDAAAQKNQNNGSLSTDSSQDISEVSTKQEVLEKVRSFPKKIQRMS